MPRRLQIKVLSFCLKTQFSTVSFLLVHQRNRKVSLHVAVFGRAAVYQKFIHGSLSRDWVVSSFCYFAALLPIVYCSRWFSSVLVLSFWSSNPGFRDDWNARTASICHFALVSLDRKGHLLEERNNNLCRFIKSAGCWFRHWALKKHFVPAL